MPNGEAEQGEPCLIAYARSLQCALPLGQVLEIMRPLPIDPISRAPSFVLGVAIVRGEPTPVIDCGAFMQVNAPPQHTRWASVRAGQRTAVLAFESIHGVRALPTQRQALPPLLSGAPSEQIAHLARLDAGLLLVLHESRLVPEEVLRLLDGDAA